jgi:hypothetical protein
VLDEDVYDRIAALGSRRALTFRYDRGLVAVSWLEGAPAPPEALVPAIGLIVAVCRPRSVQGGYR